ncbi:MAG: TolC family protein [Pseudomonadota bacterium]|nr:TolC family protein [Pseudomonadota bacterium]
MLGLAAPLVDLIALPSRTRLARIEQDRARLRIAGAVLTVSLDVEAAWYRYIGAEQVGGMRAAVAEALQTSADLAQRFFDAGNITELQLNRELAAASSARIAASRAFVDARLARLDLNTLMGLRGTQSAWNSAAVLPLPVEHEDDAVMLRQTASTSSLDLLAARKEAAIFSSSAHTTRALRLLGATTIGYDHEREVDRSVIKGPTLDLELPIFNQGGARVARADAQLRIARAKLARIELSTDNAIDLGAERVRVLSDVVRIHREALVPQREIVAARSQDEEDYALIGEFEVLLAKTQEYDAYQGFLEAVRDYWLARVDLTRLVGSRLPSDREALRNTPSVRDILHTGAPEPAAGGHAGHMMSGAPSPVSDHAGHMMAPARPPQAEPVGRGIPKMPAPDHSGHMMPVAPVPDAPIPAKQKPVEPAPAMSPDAPPEHHHPGGQS